MKEVLKWADTSATCYTNRMYAVFETEMGWMGVRATASGLSLLTLPRESFDAAFRAVCRPDDVEDALAFKVLEGRLRRYLEGEPVSFEDISLDLENATPFHHRAWQQTRTIPRGETRSYKWLAAAAGRPGAFRAAGQAMARNPVPIIIPCHRVVASDGTLHGFGGGLALKQRLLELERKR